MKKIFYYTALLLCSMMVSCDKEEVGGTAVESMAGQWYVMIDAVDENGKPISGGENYFGLEGRTLLLTYNTAGNSSEEMFVDDLGAFSLPALYGNPAYPDYSIKAKVKADTKSLTFSSNNAANETGQFGITITEGKILKGAGRQNNGSPADSIVFFVNYEGDPWYPDDGYAKYKVSGIRYSGLVENE